MLIAALALLGLAATQLKSLQFATSSFNYTVSLIYAQNAIEGIWSNICVHQDQINNGTGLDLSAQHALSQTYYPVQSDFLLNFKADTDNGNTSLTNLDNVFVEVNWSEKYTTDTESDLYKNNAFEENLNKVTLYASYYTPAMLCAQGSGNIGNVGTGSSSGGSN